MKLIPYYTITLSHHSASYPIPPRQVMPFSFLHGEAGDSDIEHGELDSEKSAARALAGVFRRKFESEVWQMLKNVFQLLGQRCSSERSDKNRMPESSSEKSQRGEWRLETQLRSCVAQRKYRAKKRPVSVVTS